jgi:hypothetical protein
VIFKIVYEKIHVNVDKVLLKRIVFSCCWYPWNLKVKNPKKPVAPGLCVPAIVEFETNEAKEIRDRLVVTVDGDVVEIPLIA